jgi:dinuclear metal center YbgI/SA1388 family protein
VDRDSLIAYLDSYLDAATGRDYCPNGLQVEGRTGIRKIVTGVSACIELFQQARQLEADALIVHHGIFWRGDELVLTGVQRQRVAELIRGELNLLAYHLPLDRHPEVGNNAVAVRRLGLTQVERFAEHEGLALGFKGLLPEPTGTQEVLDRVAELYDREPLVFAYGPAMIRSIGVLSGAGGRAFHNAIAEGLDLFITGEADEWTMNLAREAGRHFIAAGHYATERLGIRALGDHLQRQFEVDVEFVDIPNPV